MSYEILYDRRFIKTEHGIVPMILSGSNNCYEIRYKNNGQKYEVRERHWWVYQPQTLPINTTEEAHLKAWEEVFANTPEDSELFKRNGSWLTVGAHRRWFLNGCKDARLLEEYLACNPGVTFYCSLRLYQDKTKFGYDSDLGRYIKTSNELEAWLKTAKTRELEYREAHGDGCEVWTYMEFSSEKPLKTAPISSGAVVVKSGNAFVKRYMTGHSLTFSENPSDAVIFPSVEDARAAIGFCWRHIRFVKASTALAARDFVLRIGRGPYTGNYVSIRRRGQLLTTCNVEKASRYKTSPEAARAAQKILDANFRGIQQLEVYNIRESLVTRECFPRGNQ